MTWTEKLELVCAQTGASYANLERMAGWAEGSLSTKIGKGTEPMVYKAVRLATAAGVPAEWLFNPDDDSPPPIYGSRPFLGSGPQAERRAFLLAEFLDALDLVVRKAAGSPEQRQP